MGAPWLVPTSIQYEELINNTKYTWTTKNNINYGKFTSKTDSSKYIFLSTGGYCAEGIYAFGAGSQAHYWSTTYSDSTHALELYFASRSISTNAFPRHWGFPIRPVRQW